jgi:hypothetical protein
MIPLSFRSNMADGTFKVAISGTTSFVYRAVKFILEVVSSIFFSVHIFNDDVTVNSPPLLQTVSVQGRDRLCNVRKCII